jgi:cathepsin B
VVKFSIVMMARLLVLAALVTGVLSGPSLKSSVLRDSDLVVTQEMIDEINAGGMWKASDAFVKGMTVGHAKMITGTVLGPYNLPARNWGLLTQATDIPDSFDSRTQWPGCVSSIRNQGQCGSCWAFGSSEALSDRYCIQKGVNVLLSPQWLVSCDKSNHGCHGGNLFLVWAYLESNGIPVDGCDPYSSGSSKADELCPYTCADGSAPKKFKATNVHSYQTPRDIQLAILEGGPIETAFTVYQDFMSYSGGVYKHTTGSAVGGHAVKIVGWGREETTDYWIAANSWGTSWGEQGYFRIAWDQGDISRNGVAGNAY